MTENINLFTPSLCGQDPLHCLSQHNDIASCPSRSCFQSINKWLLVFSLFNFFVISETYINLYKCFAVDCGVSFLGPAVCWSVKSTRDRYSFQGHRHQGLVFWTSRIRKVCTDSDFYQLAKNKENLISTVQFCYLLLNDLLPLKLR